MATYSGWFDPNLWRQAAGNTADELATFAKVPIDTGLSELIAGGNTTNTGIKYQTPAYNPVSAPVGNMSLMPGGQSKVPGGNQTTTTTSNPQPTQTQQPTPTSTRSTTKFDPAAVWDPSTGKTFQSAFQEGLIDQYGNPINRDRSAEDERRKREEEARKNINAGFDQYVNNLQGLIPTYEGQMNTALGNAEAQYQNIFGGLQEQKQSSLDKLQGQAGQVKTMAANSIEDLKRNLNQTVRGMSMQLGAMGAGDTSASQVMMPYAYTKLAGVQEGGIQRQQNDQLFQIQQAEMDTENQFNTLWRQTETEKINSLQNIRDTYGGYINNVRNAIANAPVERARALQGLLEGLLTEASNKLTALESQDRQYKASLQDWAMGRMAELNNMKLEIANSANFDPLQIGFNELQMVNSLGGGGNTSTDSAYWNPQMLASKKRELLGLS